MTTYFCDGLKDVTIVNGVARLEFHRLEVVERGANRELRPVGEFIVALPVQGFVHALGVLENVRERFVAQGLITPARLSERRRPAASAGKIPEFFIAKETGSRLEMGAADIKRAQAVARAQGDRGEVGEPGDEDDRRPRGHVEVIGE